VELEQKKLESPEGTNDNEPPAALPESAE
jgi:hypothetical protein